MKNKTKIVYFVLMLVMTISGFGQMPIFKRYYVADLPGLGWTANFIVTHYLHYLGAIALICFFSYQIAVYLLKNKDKPKLTSFALIRVLIITILILSGLLKVIVNLKGFHFASNYIIILDIVHTSFTFLFLFFSLFAVVFKKKWID